MTQLMSYQQGVETRSAIERIAAFAAAARPERLTPDIRQLFKRNILDSLGCAIAALPGPPFQAREQFEEYNNGSLLQMWSQRSLSGAPAEVGSNVL